MAIGPLNTGFSRGLIPRAGTARQGTSLHRILEVEKVDELPKARTTIDDILKTQPAPQPPRRVVYEGPPSHPAEQEDKDALGKVTRGILDVLGELGDIQKRRAEPIPEEKASWWKRLLQGMAVGIATSQDGDLEKALGRGIGYGIATGISQRAYQRGVVEPRVLQQREHELGRQEQSALQRYQILRQTADVLGKQAELQTQQQRAQAQEEYQRERAQSQAEYQRGIIETRQQANVLAAQRQANQQRQAEWLQEIRQRQLELRELELNLRKEQAQARGTRQDKAAEARRVEDVNRRLDKLRTFRHRITVTDPATLELKTLPITFDVSLSPEQVQQMLEDYKDDARGGLTDKQISGIVEAFRSWKEQYDKIAATVSTTGKGRETPPSRQSFWERLKTGRGKLPVIR